MCSIPVIVDILITVLISATAAKAAAAVKNKNAAAAAAPRRAGAAAPTPALDAAPPHPPATAAAVAAVDRVTHIAAAAAAAAARTCDLIPRCSHRHGRRIGADSGVVQLPSLSSIPLTSFSLLALHLVLIVRVNLMLVSQMQKVWLVRVGTC
jgi:hypothetical protein